jgi:elongator complex protein 2
MEITCCPLGKLQSVIGLTADLPSSDQTTRIHACTKAPSSPHESRWAEVARPQIHGYDLTCAAWLSPYRFASGADEKVTRVFDAPGGFVESLVSLGVRELVGEDIVSLPVSVRHHVSLIHQGDRPKGATVPPLGGRSELMIPL